MNREEAIKVIRETLEDYNSDIWVLDVAACPKMLLFMEAINEIASTEQAPAQLIKAGFRKEDETLILDIVNMLIKYVD